VRGALRRHAACAAERQREQRWQDRFKCQVLLDQAAVLAAMAYVDLNPLRAKLCDTQEAAKHTSARKRLDEIAQTPALAEAKLAPIAGQRGRCVFALAQIEYLQMVDYTGRQVRADKRVAIAGPPPAILKRLGYSPDNGRASSLSDFAREMRCAAQRMDARRGAQPMALPLGSQRRRRCDAQPEGPEALLAHCEAERPIKCNKTSGIFVTALRQKRFRRTRDESPTGCQVLAIRSDFCRGVGAVEMLAEKAAAIGQFWLRGIATARRLATA